MGEAGPDHPWRTHPVRVISPVRVDTPAPHTSVPELTASPPGYSAKLDLDHDVEVSLGDPFNRASGPARLARPWEPDPLVAEDGHHGPAKPSSGLLQGRKLVLDRLAAITGADSEGGASGGRCHAAPHCVAVWSVCARIRLIWNAVVLGLPMRLQDDRADWVDPCQT